MLSFKSRILVLFFLLPVTLIYGQIGYFNRRNMLDLNVGLNSSLFTGTLKETAYRKTGNTMKETHDLVDLSISVAYSRLLSKKVAFGVLFSKKNFSVNQPDILTTYYTTTDFTNADTFSLRMENLRFYNLMFGPRLEFATKNQFLGSGFSYDLSMGMVLSNVINKAYYYQLSPSSSDQSEDSYSAIDTYTQKYDWKMFNGVYVQTGFNMRYPISKHLLLNTGLHCTTNITFKPGDLETDIQSPYLINRNDVYKKVYKRNLFYLQIHAGITWSL